ncbi:hypothetical protein L7F22_042574 [Adiantum nelumboides]|nr:hypothetical protein [Adiantum nelumboides]
MAIFRLQKILISHGNHHTCIELQRLLKRITLYLTGESDEINSALDALVYTGALNFHGYAKIWLSAKDEGGLGEEAFITMKVKHINTPPIISSYPFILVDSNTRNLLAGIDDIERETYNASSN